MVGGTNMHTMAGRVLQESPQIAATGHEDGKVIDADPAVPRDRSSRWPLTQLHQHTVAAVRGEQGRSLVRHLAPLQDVEANDVAVESERALEICDLQGDAPDTCVIGQRVTWRPHANAVARDRGVGEQDCVWCGHSAPTVRSHDSTAPTCTDR